MNEVPVSPKHAIEIADFIKNKRAGEAVAYLEDVVAGKKAIPFRKFNRNVAHKRGLSGWDAGRYPKKASEAYIRLLHSVTRNAEYIGLDAEKLTNRSRISQPGPRFTGFLPRAMGRSTPKRRETVNIEIIVREVE